MPFTFSNIHQGKLDSSNSMYFVLEWVAIFGEAKGILPLPKNCSHSLLSPQVNLDLFAHGNTSLVIEQICEDFIWCLVKFMKRVEPQSGRHKHFTARSSESSAPHLTNVWRHSAENLRSHNFTFSDLWEANWCQFHMISGKDSQCWKRLLGTVAAAAFCERLWCSMLGLSALKYGISTPFHLAHPTDSGWTTWEITERCVLCIEKQQVGGWGFRSQTKLEIQPEIASGKSIHVVQGY